MTIKEVEALTGMTRANVRFYETEGLIAPARGENGYRDYGQRDVDVLLRIKLLRMLDMPLEEIKQLHAGTRDLAPVLDEHIARLEEERERMEQSRQVCRTMRQDGVRYETLDARPYLNSFGRSEPVRRRLEQDVLPKVRAPWRRYFARMLDETLYALLCYLLYVVVLRENVLTNDNAFSLLTTLLSMVLMLVLEPLMLRLFGTTPGKAVLGLKVTDQAGDHLTYGAALFRTLGVLWRGLGLHLPVYGLICQWKSYQSCKNGETLDWEVETVLTLKDERWWRGVSYVAAVAVTFGALIGLVAMPPRAEYRGDLTVAQFSQNYNYFSDYFEIGSVSGLDKDGQWVMLDNLIGLSPGNGMAFDFVERDGVVQQVSFSKEHHNTDVMRLSEKNEMFLTVLAFAEKDLSRGELEQLLALLEHPFDDWQTTAFGLSITCQVDYDGFIEVDASVPTLIVEQEENHYSVVFTVERSA